MCKSVSDSVILHLYKVNECTLVINKINYWIASFNFTKSMYDVQNCVNDANSISTGGITHLL